MAWAWAGVAVALCVGEASAAPIVNAGQTIDRRVTIQPIIVSNDDGSNTATFLGSPAEQLAIETYFDQIYAQAGIDILLLSPNTYNNSFANIGTSGAGTRPTSDLSTIVNGAPTGTVKNTNPLVLNMFFVQVAAGFSPQNLNTAAGLARLPGNGSTVYVGSNLLSFDAGRTVIAGVLMHEVGHNLGLAHTADGIANLMSPNGTSDQLDAGQIATIRLSQFAVSIAPVPEPSTVLAVGAFGVLAIFGVRRRNPRRAAA
jgi:hypothetical protein